MSQPSSIAASDSPAAPVRPTSITVIAWFTIVSAAFSSISTLVTRDNPMVKEMLSRSPLPLEVQYAQAGAHILVMLACAIGWLNAASWSRHLYAGWTGLVLVVSVVTSPLSKLALIPSVVFFAIVLFFLYRAPATAYFTARRT